MELEYKFAVQDLISEGRTTEVDVEIIRTWIKTLEEACVPPKLQDEVIALFLLSCDNDIDLTMKTIIAFYKCKKNAPEIYDDRNIYRNDLQTALNTVHMASLPVRTDENYAVHYFNVYDTNYQNFNLVPIMKASYMLVDVTQEKNPPNGLIVLIDMKGFGLLHMTKMKVGAIKKYLHFLQEGFPMQLKSIHILNGSYLIDRVMAIIKVFMKSQLINMIHIHSAGISDEDLFKLIPKKCLPKDYGGELPSERDLHAITMKQFKEKQHFWEVEERMRKEFRK